MSSGRPLASGPMSASNGRPLGATATRSGAAAPARRTVRKYWFVVRSNWLKTRLPWNSLTLVAAPGVATVWALAAAGRARIVRMAARSRRRMPLETPRLDGSDAEGFDVLLDLVCGRRPDEDACDVRMLEGKGDRDCGGWYVQLRTEGDELMRRGEGGLVLGVVSLVLEAAVRAFVGVLACQRAARERGRGDDARLAGRRRRGRLGVLDGRAADEAVRELDRRGHRDALALGGRRGFGEQVGAPVEQTPRAQLAAFDQRAHLRDDLVDAQTGRRLLRVREVQVVEPHAREPGVELARPALLGPELPPQLVGDGHLVALPAGGAEQLAEDDLGVSGRDRRRARLVVVPGVVEEVDAGLARRAHHRDALLARRAPRRPPVRGGPAPARPPGAGRAARQWGGGPPEARVLERAHW